MSVGIGAALVSILVPLACVGWNMGLPRWAMRPGQERLTTGTSTVFAVVSFGAGVPFWLGGIGLVISASLLALTFFSRLPQQRPAVAAGDPAPDFALTDADGVVRHLRDYAGQWVVLKFYRGYWCPYCVRELHDWEAMLDRLDARRITLIAISPDRVEELRGFRSKTGFKMTLLADPENQVARRYNLQNRNFTPKRGPFRELVIPATLLIDERRIVRWLDQASDFRVRRSAQEIMSRIDVLLPGTGPSSCAICADQESVAG